MAVFDPCKRPGTGRAGEGLTKITEGEVADAAKLLKVDAYRTEDGRVVVNYPGRDKSLSAPISYKDDSEAIRAITGLAQSTVDRVDTHARLEKQVQEGRVPSPDIDGDMSQVMAAFEKYRMNMDDIERYMQSAADLGWFRRQWYKGKTAMQGPAEFLFRVQSKLKGIGPEGVQMAEMMLQRDDLYARYEGYALKELNDIFSTLTPEEDAGGFISYIEDGIQPADPSRVVIMDEAYARLRKLKDHQYNEGTKYGLRMKKWIERYWPHRFDMGMIQREPHAMVEAAQWYVDQGLISGIEPNTKITSPTSDLFYRVQDVMDQAGFGTTREKAIRQTADKLLKRNAAAREKDPRLPALIPDVARVDAEQMLDRYVRKSAVRRSSHMEHDRHGVSGYMRDARRAWTVAILGDARRLSEAAVYGPEYGALKTMVSIIDRKYGAKAGQFAKQVMEQELGLVDQGDMHSFWKGLMRWQAVKLSLSFLWNTTGSANTLVRFGPGAMARGIGSLAKARIAQKSSAAAYLRESGAASNMYILGSSDLHTAVQKTAVELAEEGFSSMGQLSYKDKFVAGAKTIKEVIESIAVSPFNIVELMANRNLSVHTAEQYFKREAQNLFSPNKKTATLAADRIRELRISPAAVRAAMKAGDKELLQEMQMIAGLRGTNETQFKARLLDMPLLAQSPTTKALYQFKTYPINQAAFVLRELDFKTHRDKARFTRGLAALLFGYPTLGIALSKARSTLLGPTLTTEAIDENLERGDVRGMLVAGAIGLATSGMMGLAADYVGTSMMANRFQLHSFFVPPVASSGLSAAEIAISGTKAIVTGDEASARTARNAALSEMGGAGSMIRNLFYDDD